MKIKIKTETISTDPWKFSGYAEVSTTVDVIDFVYIGDEGESRAQVKRQARKGLERKLSKMQL